MEAFTAADVRAAEAPLLAAERSFAGGLMHAAATALARAVRRELRLRAGQVCGATVVGLVGPGNNGGDTLHALALLASRGVRTVAVLTSAAVHDGGLVALRAQRGRVLTVVGDGPGERVWLGDALAETFAADVVLDGLLGIGGHGGLRGTAAELVRLLAELCADLPPATRPAVLAVDLPSGIGVDDGTLPGPVLPADRTVTFGAAKPGLLLPPACHLVGTLEVVDLGLTPVLSTHGRQPAVGRLTQEDLGALWPVPGPSAQKYSRGVVGVVAGSAAYPGAAVLSVAGAQGAGSGMVRYVGPPAVAEAVVAAHPEVVAGDGQVQAWVLGPGTGQDDEQTGRVRQTLAHATRDRMPVVVDAGALGLIGERVGPQVVLTPHAGELARLLTARGADVDRAGVEAEPLRWAREAHRLTGATVLLKGSATVVVGPGVVLVQAEAPPWLATAGAGDVLAGVLGTVLAGHAEQLAAPDGDPALAARLAAAAASVHGRAAALVNPGGPISAGQVAAAVPTAISRLLTVPAAVGRPAVRPRPHRATRRVVRR